MSISQNFPNTRPSLNLNFARSKTLDPRITFIRPQTGNGVTYVGEDGLIKYPSADEPRFDHDPETGECLGLLVEESRVNYEKYTEDPTQWTISNMIPTGIGTALPTGEVSTTIEYRGETTDPNSKLIRPLPINSSVVAGETWCFSIFLKAGTEDTVNINLTNNTATEGVRVNSFNMLTGEDSGIVETGGTTNGEFNAVSYPNEWWRISIRSTYSLNAPGQQTLIRLKGFSNQVTETTSFSAWGAQLEKAPFPTSYIPNGTDSTATRNPDKVSMEGDNFSDWYNQSEGTFLLKSAMANPGNGQNQFLIRASNNTYSNAVGIFDGGNGTASISVTVDGLFQGLTGSINTVQKNSLFAVCSAYKFNDLALTLNSNSIAVDDDGAPIPTDLNRFDIGKDHANATANGLDAGTISQIVYYPRRLTNTQLQNLTK